MLCDNVNLMGQETWHMSDKQAAKAHNFPLSKMYLIFFKGERNYLDI